MSLLGFRKKTIQIPTFISQNSLDVDSGISGDSDTDSLSADDYEGKLLAVMRERMIHKNNVKWSRKYCELPCLKLASFQKEIVAASTGPGEGARKIEFDNPIKKNSKKNSKKNRKNDDSDQWCSWTKRHQRAYGICTSLYDCDPVTQRTSGDPVADVYAVIARPNGCILALADGVNWGEKSKLAAQCAVGGCLQYLSTNLFSATNTHDVMYQLLKGFEHAQSCIIEHEATMTTLCTAVVCELEGTDQWGLCCVNVGDSLAFVFDNNTGVREVTLGSHFGEGSRDMRSPGGSLGPSDGYNPDLSNLTFSFTLVNSGDIVFLTSDGVSDNFDPVVSKCHHCDAPELKQALSLESQLEVISNARTRLEKKKLDSLKTRSDSDPPRYCQWDIPTEKHKKILSDMTQIIQEEGLEDHVSAAEVCAKLLSYACRCTEQKRTFLEQVDKDDHSVDNSNKQLRKVRERGIARMMRDMPGKLDHAAVVAFEVGFFQPEAVKPEAVKPGSKGQVQKEKAKKGLGDFLSGFPWRRRFSSSSSIELESSEIKSDNYTELYSLLGV